MSREKHNKDEVIADHRTGAYTQRELAKKHGISVSTVNQITKGIEKDRAHIVSKEIEIIQETERLTNKKIEFNQITTGLNEQEANAVYFAVRFKLGLADSVQSFCEKAIKKAGYLLEVEESGYGLKAIIEGVDKITVMAGINPRFAPSASTQINNTNAQQNNDRTMTLDEFYGG